MCFGVLLEQPGVLEDLLIRGCAFIALRMHTRYFFSGLSNFAVAWQCNAYLGWDYTPGASNLLTCFEFRLACFECRSACLEFRPACSARALPTSALLGLFGHSLICLGTP